MHLFQGDRYLHLADEYNPQFTGAEPFPHVVIDDFLPVLVCERVLADFPDPHSQAWRQLKSSNQNKLAAQKDAELPSFTRHILRELNSPGCLQFLERLTGIGGLIPDPYYDGGGLHQITNGGFLKIHVDFNKQTRLKLDRRLNLIIYLNKDWREEYNGHLELWDRTMSRCVRKVLPMWNRAVVFATTDWAYHGHPEKLACPAGQSRKSLALYYYTNGRPGEERTEGHGVIWEERRGGWESGHASATLLRGMAGLLERPARWLRKRANRLTA
jgi:Rps23 Pro-64 3,4-dihydroxylase Tpa1-like proline 4-hydroxylase